MNRRLIAAITTGLVLLLCSHYKLFATITLRKTGKNKILILNLLSSLYLCWTLFWQWRPLSKILSVNKHKILNVVKHTIQ